MLLAYSHERVLEHTHSRDFFNFCHALTSSSFSTSTVHNVWKLGLKSVPGAGFSGLHWKRCKKPREGQ
jgi:hypothetical protein